MKHQDAPGVNVGSVADRALAAPAQGRASNPPVMRASQLAAIMRPELPDLAREIIAEIRARIPEYARPMEGPYGHALRTGVQQALTSFFDSVADPSAPHEQRDHVCRMLDTGPERMAVRPLHRARVLGDPGADLRDDVAGKVGKLGPHDGRKLRRAHDWRIARPALRRCRQGTISHRSDINARRVLMLHRRATMDRKSSRPHPVQPLPDR